MFEEEIIDYNKLNFNISKNFIDFFNNIDISDHEKEIFYFLHNVIFSNNKIIIMGDKRKYSTVTSKFNISNKDLSEIEYFILKKINFTIWKIWMNLTECFFSKQILYTNSLKIIFINNNLFFKYFRFINNISDFNSTKKWIKGPYVNNVPTFVFFETDKLFRTKYFKDWLFPKNSSYNLKNFYNKADSKFSIGISESKLLLTFFGLSADFLNYVLPKDYVYPYDRENITDYLEKTLNNNNEKVAKKKFIYIFINKYKNIYGSGTKLIPLTDFKKTNVIDNLKKFKMNNDYNSENFYFITYLKKEYLLFLDTDFLNCSDWTKVKDYVISVIKNKYFITEKELLEIFAIKFKNFYKKIFSHFGTFKLNLDSKFFSHILMALINYIFKKSSEFKVSNKIIWDSTIGKSFYDFLIFKFNSEKRLNIRNFLYDFEKRVSASLVRNCFSRLIKEKKIIQIDNYNYEKSIFFNPNNEILQDLRNEFEKNIKFNVKIIEISNENLNNFIHFNAYSTDRYEFLNHLYLLEEVKKIIKNNNFLGESPDSWKITIILK